MDYKRVISDNLEEEIQGLRQLISIRSKKESPVTGKEGVYPFGKAVQDAFSCFLERASEMGFVTKNVDNYGGHIEFGQGDEILGIACHLDVVPEGEGWKYEPFGGNVADGYIYGRGAIDDKGPAIACLYALKALRESGFEPDKRIRLIVGLDEESGSQGMEYYLKREGQIDLGFTPDGEFPVIYCEKGIMLFQIACRLKNSGAKGLELRSLSGGEAPNMVPEKCRAVIYSTAGGGYESIKEEAARFREETKRKINVKGIGKSIEITAHGKSAHGAFPKEGENAISILMDFLGRINLVNDELTSFINFYNSHIGYDTDGRGLNIDFFDEETGDTTVNCGVIELNKEALTLTVNVRYPANRRGEDIYENIQPILDERNLGVVKLGDYEPLYSPVDGELIETLLRAYRNNTGDFESKPIVTGGGTYARLFNNMVAFGAQFPKDEDRMHKADERLSIENLKLMTEIYADAIFSLAGGDYE